MQNTLSLVIVNWNAGSQLRDCVTSILTSNQSYFKLDKIIIVDNDSTDDSLNLLPQNERIIVVTNEVNFGFGKACNIGAIQTTSDLLLFLNPDTCLKNDSLDIAVNFYNNNASSMNFGILGVKLLNPDDSIQKTCSRFPSLMSECYDRTGLAKLFPDKSSKMNEFFHDESRYVDQVMGAFFLTSRQLFDKIKGFDESFFVYYEEVDFSYRARKLGYKSYFLAETSAVHVGGGCSQQVKAKRLFYSLNSRLIYAKKHFSALDYLLVSGLTLFVEPFSRCVFSLLKKDFKGLMETLSGYKMLYNGLLNK